MWNSVYPVKPQSAFHAKSLGKTFTAVGIMILVNEGRIGLDDKIAKYFHESHRWKNVTVRQLLTHTSGIPDYVAEFGGAPFISFRQDYTEEELVRLIAAWPLDFQPGEKRVYCNSGYVLLGALIRHGFMVDVTSPFHSLPNFWELGR
jgi:D-alanyl-D-alanine carboxypeptidase